MRSRLGLAIHYWIPQPLRRRLLFLRYHGRWGNFKSPRTFSEKVNWRILNDRRPGLAWTCDKLAIKERAAELGIRCPKTYWQGEHISTLAGVALPERWVLKPNHRSSLVYFGHGEPDIEHLVRLTSGWTDETQSKLVGEWAYSQARPLLLVEEELEPTGALYEYKFFVMNGRAEFIQVDFDRFGHHRRNMYTRHWDPFDSQFQCAIGEYGPPPERLPDMIAAAEQVAGDLDFLRVDLYYVGGEIYLGEVAAYPGSGLVRHRPYSSNIEIGSRWQLPSIRTDELGGNRISINQR
jgi:hypothetical protein